MSSQPPPPSYQPPIQLICPQCNTQLSLPGWTPQCQCPRCATIMQVPAPQPHATLPVAQVVQQPSSNYYPTQTASNYIHNNPNLPPPTNSSSSSGYSGGTVAAAGAGGLLAGGLIGSLIESASDAARYGGYGNRGFGSMPLGYTGYNSYYGSGLNSFGGILHSSWGMGGGGWGHHHGGGHEGHHRR